MSAAEQLWAYTEPGTQFPAYINVQVNEAGVHLLTVRERGHNGERCATIEMQPQLMRALAEALLIRLAGIDDGAVAAVLDRAA